MNPLRELLVLLAPAAAVVLVRATSRRPADKRVELLALLLFVTVFMALIQFPFGAPVYFQYVLPLVVLTAVSFSSVTRSIWGVLGVAVVVTYSLSASSTCSRACGLWRDVTGGSGLCRAGSRPWPHLHSGNRGCDVPAGDVAPPSTRARRCDDRWTGCARLYFLADLRNPTPMIYDLLTRTSVRDHDILGAIAQDRITAIVVNRSPPFSLRYHPSLLSRLEEDFPHHVSVGQYDVRWRS